MDDLARAVLYRLAIVTEAKVWERSCQQSRVVWATYSIGTLQRAENQGLGS